VPPGSTNEVRGARLGIQGVDVALQPFDLACEHPQALRLALALGHREVGAEIEQIVLDQAQHRIELARLRQMQPHHADRGVGLVDGSIGAMRRSYFGRRSPLPSAVVPSSPVRV
jgi:hypothetical protein